MSASALKRKRRPRQLPPIMRSMRARAPRSGQRGVRAARPCGSRASGRRRASTISFSDHSAPFAREPAEFPAARRGSLSRRRGPDRSPLQYPLSARPSMFGSTPPKSENEQARGGFIKRLRARLNRATRGSPWISATSFEAAAIDAAILDELETRLLSADVGVEATHYILESLRQRVARSELADVEALIAALRATIVGDPRPLRAAAGDRSGASAVRHSRRRRQRLGQDDHYRQARRAGSPHKASA